MPKTTHAAAYSGGLRAIAQGVLAPGSTFTTTQVSECFVVAATRMAILEKIEQTAREFCAKVDRGEARSVKTYAEFAKSLEQIDNSA